MGQRRGAMQEEQQAQRETREDGVLAPSLHQERDDEGCQHPQHVATRRAGNGRQRRRRAADHRDPRDEHHETLEVACLCEQQHGQAPAESRDARGHRRPAHAPHRAARLVTRAEPPSPVSAGGEADLEDRPGHEALARRGAAQQDKEQDRVERRRGRVEGRSPEIELELSGPELRGRDLPQPLERCRRRSPHAPHRTRKTTRITNPPTLSVPLSPLSRQSPRRTAHCWPLPSIGGGGQQPGRPEVRRPRGNARPT